MAHLLIAPFFVCERGCLVHTLLCGRGFFFVLAFPRLSCGKSFQPRWACFSASKSSKPLAKTKIMKAAQRLVCPTIKIHPPQILNKDCASLKSPDSVISESESPSESGWMSQATGDPPLRRRGHVFSSRDAVPSKLCVCAMCLTHVSILFDLVI